MVLSFEILRLSQITKSYGSKLVLDGIDLKLSRGERVALVGENGVGKSTLSRIITGEEEADSGSIRLMDGAELGYLPQEVTGDEGMSVHAYIERALGSLKHLREQMQVLEQRMTQPLSEMEMDVVLEEYGEVQGQFEQRGGYEIDSRIQQIFSGLGIDYIEQDRLLATLSGGERTRVALTALLLREPELLVLDEPTNHLDFAGIEWLEKYLADYPHALLLITHDRTFINRVANVISELNAKTKQLHPYYGNYEDYLAARQREYDEQVEAFNTQKNEMKALQRTLKQLSHNTKITGAFTDIEDKFLKNFKRERGESFISKEARSARKQLEGLQENKMANPRHEWNIDFRFEPLELGSAEPLRFENVSKRFGENPLFDNLTTIVPKGERVVLVAPNGTGKSTLLRMVMGLQQPDKGKIVISPSAKIGYLDQDGETLDGERTVLEVFREYMQGSDSELMTELHRSGLFADAALTKKKVKDLSVGQRRKLGLACIIASKANLLLLDEPTNHLDLLSLEALEEALIGFEGTILAVSHDRRFVEKVATEVWEIKGKGLSQRQQAREEEKQ
jgi:macrolide transport system ATP-binding/permease protein